MFIITCKPERKYCPINEIIDGVEFDRISFAISKDPIRLWHAIRKKVKHHLIEEEPWVAHVHNPLVGAFALNNEMHIENSKDISLSQFMV